MKPFKGNDLIARLLRFSQRSLVLLLLPACLNLAQASHSSEFFLNDWKEASSEARELVQSLSPLDDVITLNASTAMAVQPLPFYRGISLVMAYGAWEPSDLALYFLITDKGEVERITGRTDLLERLRKGGFYNPEPDYIDNYVWFTLFFSRGEDHKPVLVLESEKSLYFPDPAQLEESLATRLVANVRPISCTAVPSSGYNCDASVLLDQVLYKVSLTVGAEGELELQGSRPLLKGIPYDPVAPIGAWAVNGDVKMKVPDQERKDAANASADAQSGWSF